MKRSACRRAAEPGQALAATLRGGLIVDIRSEAQRLEQGLVPDAWFVPRNVLEWRADPACAHHDPRLVAVTGPLVDQSEIVADFRDPAIQQHADEAIHRFAEKLRSHQ